jgi:hypothetical protein
MSKYFISIVFFALSLLGCGGGGSDSGNSNDGGNSGSLSYVAGEFKTATSPGFYAPSDIMAYGLGNITCIGEYNYFESENVLVYGNSSLESEDFQYAATLVENKLNEALSLIGISREEFDDKRPQYTPGIGRKIVSMFRNGIADISIIDPDLVNTWDSLDPTKQEAILKSHWNGLSDVGQTELTVIYTELLADMNLTENTLPEKIGVCLDADMNSTRFGEGTLFGMNLAPKSVASRSDAEQVVLHELIHTIQINVAMPENDSSSIIDIWFLEGQATFLAGQQVAKSANGYYPVDVVIESDAGNQFQGDGGLAYSHYSKAYSYIDSHSKSSIMDFFLDVRGYNGNNNTGFPNGSSYRFSDAFDSNMKKSNDSVLTLDDFRANYHSIMNNQ